MLALTVIPVRKVGAILPNYNDTYEPEKQAEKYDMNVNPKADHVLKILEKLGKNEQQLGKPYCPCLPQHTEDTVCPCKNMRLLKACRCGLYVQTDNS